MPMPANGIISKCKIKLSRKILPVYKLTTLKIRHFFLECLGSIFLDYYILLCDMQIGSQALVSLSFVPPGQGANSSLN